MDLQILLIRYDEAKRKTLEVGKEQVNKDYIYIKFYCTPDTRPQT